MVTTLNITVDDDVADRARDVKEEHGLTWAEVIEKVPEWAPDAHAPRERRETAPEPTPVESSTEDNETTQERTAAVDVPDTPEVSADVDEILSGLDFGTVRKGTAGDRRDTLRAAYDLLQSKGQARRRHFRELFEQQVGWSDSFDSWYENFLKEYLPQLPGATYVGGQGSGTWEFREGRES